MQRMTVPAGHNQTTRCYKRSTSEAFLCNAEEAQAFHYFPKKKRPGRWLAAIILGLVLIALFALAGCAKPAPQPMQVSQERAIPQGVCAKGDVGIWLDATTITCHKEMK